MSNVTVVSLTTTEVSTSFTTYCPESAATSLNSTVPVPSSTPAIISSASTPVAESSVPATSAPESSSPVSSAPVSSAATSSAPVHNISINSTDISSGAGVRGAAVGSVAGVFALAAFLL